MEILIIVGVIGILAFNILMKMPTPKQHGRAVKKDGDPLDKAYAVLDQDKPLASPEVDALLSPIRTEAQKALRRAKALRKLADESYDTGNLNAEAEREATELSRACQELEKKAEDLYGRLDFRTQAGSTKARNVWEIAMDAASEAEMAVSDFEVARADIEGDA